jgi:ankyrin repeat protein
LIKILLQFGADINHRNLYLRTVGYNCHLEVFRFLIDNGLDYNLKDIPGRSLIFQIIEKDYYNHFASNYLQEFKQKIEILIKNGLDLNDTDPEDENILHYIFRQGFNIYKPIFYWLYKRGADLRLKNCDDVSPIEIASNENIIQILKFGLAKNDSTLIQEVLSKFDSVSLDEFFKIVILTDPKNVFIVNEIQSYISDRISVLINALSSKNIPKDCTKYILSKMIYP